MVQNEGIFVEIQWKNTSNQFTILLFLTAGWEEKVSSWYRGTRVGGVTQAGDWARITAGPLSKGSVDTIAKQWPQIYF